jgi:HK97 family phage major capsid protein
VRFDLSVSDREGQAIRNAAAARGQTQNEYIRRRVQVTEPGPYRFEGLNGDSLVRDLAQTSGYSAGDSKETDAAFDRLRKFQEWVADVQFAPQTLTTAGAIVPPGYQSVAPLTVTADRPLYNACEHAPISNAAVFTIPRTTSSDGVIPATRAEGAQPAGADPTFGTTTVTPAGIAGFVDITRELADSASPGGDAVMLQILNEDMNRKVEDLIYAALNSTAGAGGTITTGFVPSGAMAIVDAAPTTGLLITLRKQNYRFANVRRQRPRNTVAGAAALDNLGGLVADESSSSDGALTTVAGSKVNAAVNTFGTAAGDARTLTLGSGDVWCFTSPPQGFRFDEQAGPALVRVALWGYVAVAIVRANGISAIRF